MQYSDHFLLSKLSKNEKYAYNEIFRRYYFRIYNYVRNYVLNDEVAKELTQDTFLLLWEKRSSLKKNTNLKAYLFIISRNNCINYLRHATAKRNYSEFTRYRFEDLRLNYVALKDEISEKIIYNELFYKIQKAIDQLPPKCKNIFMLSRFKEFKNREIAESLNISIKTVENQITEALKKIRNQIKEFI